MARAKLMAAGGVAGAVLLLAGCGKDDAAPVETPALPVVAVTVAVRDVEIVSEWIGTTKGFIDAQIRPKVQGYLLEQVYTNGAYVKKGELLFTIDPRPFKATLDATLARKKSAQAQLRKFEQDVARYAPLAKIGAVSQEDLDTATAQRDVALASIAEADAAIEAAQLNLDWCRVTAPIDGFAGISSAQVGDLVAAVNVLTTLSCVAPAKVEFPVSEREYLGAMQRVLREKREDLEVTLILADGNEYPEKGAITGIDDQIGASTGTIHVEAQFPNPGNILRPGLYARVRGVTGMYTNAVVVPQRAVMETQGTRSVIVVKPDNTTQPVAVKTGPRSGTDWVILEGLKQGDRIVVEGLQKARAGTKVMPLTPDEYKAKTAPAPAAAK